MTTKKGGLNSLLSNKTFVFFAVFATVLVAALIAYFTGAFDFLKTENKDSVEKSQDYGEYSDLAQNLIDGRWVGKMEVTSIEGSSETYRSSSAYTVDLDIEFSQREDRDDLINLDFFGTAMISYTTPKVEIFMDGFRGAEIILERSGTIAEISGKLSGTNTPKQYNQAAFMQFWPESTKALATPVTVTTYYSQGVPSQTERFTPDNYCGWAGNFCALWELKNISFMPDGEDRIKLTLKESLDPDYTEQSKIVGYLEKVSQKEFSDDLEEGSSLETKGNEFLKVKLDSLKAMTEAELLLDPNSFLNIEKEMSDEAVLELLRGKMLGSIKDLGGNKFKVTTPATGISVRGTDFSVSVSEDGTTFVLVYNGEVSVTHNKTGKEIILKKGQYTVSSDKELKAYDSNIKEMPSW